VDLGLRYEMKHHSHRDAQPADEVPRLNAVPIATSQCRDTIAPAVEPRVLLDWPTPARTAIRGRQVRPSTTRDAGACVG